MPVQYDMHSQTVRSFSLLKYKVSFTHDGFPVRGRSYVSSRNDRRVSPSAGYAARIRAAVRPHIVFTESVAGNPTAEVEISTSPTGEIVSIRLAKPSGVPAWDEAVTRALRRTQKLPSDGGRYWNPMTIVFKVHD